MSSYGRGWVSLLVLNAISDHRAVAHAGVVGNEGVAPQTGRARDLGPVANLRGRANAGRVVDVARVGHPATPIGVLVSPDVPIAAVVQRRQPAATLARIDVGNRSAGLDEIDANGTGTAVFAGFRHQCR